MKMPTTIVLPQSTDITPLSRMIAPASFRARIDFGILMLWAVTMLSVGAAMHFSAQSSEFSVFELLAPF
jgi:hypothetical protein